MCENKCCCSKTEDVICNYVSTIDVGEFSSTLTTNEGAPYVVAEKGCCGCEETFVTNLALTSKTNVILNGKILPRVQNLNIYNSNISDKIVSLSFIINGDLLPEEFSFENHKLQVIVKIENKDVILFDEEVVVTDTSIVANNDNLVVSMSVHFKVIKK